MSNASNAKVACRSSCQFKNRNCLQSSMIKFNDDYEATFEANGIVPEIYTPKATP